MSKPAVTRLFVGSIIAVIAGIVLAAFAIVAMFAEGAVVVDGPDIVGFDPTTFTWTMVGLIAVATLTMVGGAIGGLIAWIGALLNTARLDDKTWFILLLVLGLFSFGLFAMIAYVIAGPDGTRIPAATTDRSMHVGGAPA